MRPRTDLHEIFEQIMEEEYGAGGSKRVYYKAPPNTIMQYPCIKYSRSGIRQIRANNNSYITVGQYNILLIDPNPDNPVIMKLLELPNCRYDRQYIAQNLYHDSLTIEF